jgi:hypothetical protein
MVCSVHSEARCSLSGWNVCLGQSEHDSIANKLPAPSSLATSPAAQYPFSNSTQFIMATVRAAVDSREKCHWSHACSLQANMRVVQWHPRVQNPVEKRTLYLRLAFCLSMTFIVDVRVDTAHGTASNRLCTCVGKVLTCSTLRLRLALSVLLAPLVLVLTSRTSLVVRRHVHGCAGKEVDAHRARGWILRTPGFQLQQHQP